MTRRLSIIRLVLLAVAAASLLAGTAAFAQTKALVRVPFAFTANHQTFPAGEYKLELLSDRVLSFTNNNTGKHCALIMVRPEPVPYIESRGAIRFLRSEDRSGDRSKDRHYLAEIRFAGSSTHSMPITRHSLERELAQLHQASTPIEIAMR